MNNLKIYKASAGSGKTHTLTVEFLKLAAKSPDNFKKILAVTFTNKASEEMKIRILEALNEIITLSKKADFYAVFAESFTNLNENEVIIKAKQIRDNILHNYSLFSISTIDSFVQKVIRSFTYEIGIQNGYNIELDTDKVIFELTDLLYKKINDDQNLKNWLINFAFYKVDVGKNWDFRSEIQKLAKEIFREQFQALNEDKENSKHADYQDITNYYNELIKIRNSFAKNMSDISIETKKVLKSNNINNSDLGQKFKYIADYLIVHINNPDNYEKYKPSKTIYEIIDDIDLWTAKKAKDDIRNKVASIFPEVNRLLNNAFDELKNNYKYYLSAINILSNFHAFGILNSLAELLPEYREENNILLISDTTKILKEIIGGNDAPFIYEKIGNKYSHILIDEFQDTSNFQWENFKPLLTNSIAENNFNLIVGDIKQSIYRWRGGDWKLLLSTVKKEIGEIYIDEETLDTNWRSKKNIIDFNNSIFSNAAEKLQYIFDNELDEHSNINDIDKEIYNNVIKSAYSDIHQSTSPNSAKSGGRVKINFVQKTGNSDKEWKENVSKMLPQTIDNLLKNKNYHPGDIAILVRKNGEGKNVAELLLNYQNSSNEAYKYQIISSESLYLSNSPIVRILINALYYIHNQSDNIHLHALLSEYINLFDLKINFNSFESNENITKILPINFIKEISNLKKLPVYEVIEKLITLLSLSAFSKQLAYLQSFQDVVNDFSQSNLSDLELFLQWWEEKGKSISVKLSELQDALKIMTIHKSKGLAFKIVIIPYCDWSLEPETYTNTIIWAKPVIEPFNKINRVPVLYRKYLSESTFFKEYFDERLYTYIDSLNLLYVAFTRPKEELLIFAPYNTKSNGISKVSDLLYNLVSDKFITDNQELIKISDYFDIENNIFEYSSGYKTIDDRKFSKDNSQVKTFEIEKYPKSDWNSKVDIKHHSDEFFMKSIKYIEEKVNYGNLMHEIFAKINTEKDIENALSEMYYSGKINSTDKDFLLNKIRNIINQTEVKNWFSDKWTIKTEDSILSTSGQLKIPDRVLISEKETIVIDFKFGEINENYKYQVKEYMKLLEEMNYPNVKGFLFYAEKNKTVEVA
ncbi:MAG: UvrD-helicase domain-containing protein [Bacteroidales bacterium]|nr:UvrD-helicase domain-containing protein [Bacteroidales bacterium]MBN2755963.1 UvrD-helicase domain-containing protein [Bacteroidales bacterium]